MLRYLSPLTRNSATALRRLHTTARVMSLPTQQKAWILANPPTGAVQPDTFALVTRDLPALADDSVLLRVDYLSNDPTQRNWISAKDGIVAKGEDFKASGLATVIESKSPKYKAGQVVIGYFGWVDYAVVPAAAIQREAPQLPGRPAIALGILGATGATAYHGVFNVLDVKPEHTVVISGAAGAVGSAAIQFAKIAGAKKVVAIAGGPEKVAFVESLGADKGIDYKSPTFVEDLRDAIGPEGADRAFENVGGKVLDAVIPNIKEHGIIGLCGLITTYNGDPTTLNNLLDLIKKRAAIQGFSIVDFIPQIPKAAGDIVGWIKEGKVSVEAETVVPTPFEKVPETWARLFTGHNQGKLVTEIKH